MDNKIINKLNGEFSVAEDLTLSRCAKSPDFAPQKTTKLCQSTITLHKTLTKYEKK